MISGVVHANTSVISYDEWLRRISASCMTLVEHIEQLWILYFRHIFFFTFSPQLCKLQTYPVPCKCSYVLAGLIVVMIEDDSIRGRLERMVQEVQDINELTINLVVQVGRNGPVSLRRLLILLWLLTLILLNPYMQSCTTPLCITSLQSSISII